MNIPSYKFRAVHSSGRIHCGRTVAPNEFVLEEGLNISGLELIEAKTCNSSAKFPVLSFSFKQSDIKQRIALCSQMEDLLRSGMGVLPALEYIASATPSGKLRDALSGITRAVSQGTPIKSAFGFYPHMFNPVFIAILAAGEAGGDLVSTFARLTLQLRRQSKLQEQLGRALRYPLFLLCVAIAVTSFMLALVVPQIVEFLYTISGELPLLTRILISASKVFIAGWWAFLLALSVCVSGLMIARRISEKTVLITDKWLLVIPVIGLVVKKLAIARFAHSFAILLRSGVELTSSLRIASKVLGNRSLIAEAYEAEKKLYSGCLFSVATSRLFPPFVTQLIRVGEQSGTLIKTMEETSVYYDKEVQASVEGFIGALEPALTIIVGILLAWVVFAVLGPVYGSLENLNQVQ